MGDDVWFRANGRWRRRADGSWHGHLEMTTGSVDRKLLENLAPKFLAQLIEHGDSTASAGEVGLAEVGANAREHVDGFLGEEGALSNKSAEQRLHENKA